MNNINETFNELLLTINKTPDIRSVFCSMAFALALAVLVYCTYRLANTKDSYQPYFAVTLVSLVLLSTVLMCLIQSNLALSLGMLGSLSIVRFRTFIKDPRDIGFIFWSMAAGLSAATQCYMIGIIGSAFMAMVMVLTRVRENGISEMMLVIRGSRSDIGSIQGIIGESCKRNLVKAKNILSDSYELVYEVRVEIQYSDYMIDRIMSLGGVDCVNLLAKQEKVA